MNPRAPQAVCFGSEGRELFGWLHAGDPSARLALVICSPFGSEEVFAHRGLRALAQASAARGVPALRFDYDGTGDSAGDELAPDRVGAWLASLHDAIDAAKQWSGAQQVCLLGVRFGAALAALAASTRDDIAAFAAIAPVISGRSFARELRVMNMAGVGTDTGDDSLIDSSNFVLARDTLDAMGRIDLLALPRPPAARLLLIERDDLAGESAWAPTLRSQGAQPSCPAIAGYAVLMDSGVPVSMIEHVTRWLGGLTIDAMPAQRGGSAAVLRDHLVAQPGVHERAIQVDAGVPLAGILSTPADWDTGVRPPQRKAVLLLAAGIGRHIGQARLHVDLARRLAAQGHVVLRLDLAGFGNSPAHPGQSENARYGADAIADVIAATRHLCELSGVAACHVIGHCSGAYNAFRAAVQGAAVASVLQFNPAIFSLRDRRVFVRAKTPSLGPNGPRSNRASFAERAHAIVSTMVGLRRLALAARHVRRAMAGRWRALAAHGFRRELRALDQRGITLHFVFGSVGSLESRLREQGGQVLPTLLRKGRASIASIAGADHIVTRWRHRQQLLAILSDLINQAPAALDTALAPHAAACDPRHAWRPTGRTH